MAITVRRWDDPASWNEFAASVPGAHFQQSWEWGELAPELGGRAYRLAATDGDRMVAAMQVFANPLPRTGRTHLYVPRGPFCSTAPSLELLGTTLDAARDLGEELHAIGIRLEPNAACCDARWKACLGSLGFRPAYPPGQPRSAWVLDLADDDTLLANMKQKTRYNIRLAARKGVEVGEGSDANLDEFYALYRQTAERDDFLVLPKTVYARMFSVFALTGSFRMLLARFRGELIAAITLIRFGDTCWYLQGASSNAHRNLMATYLLQWEGIQQAKRWGCALYDFRAVPDVLREDQDMFGVYRFKEGFGGRHVTCLDTYAAPYDPFVFGLWQLWYRGRFELTAWQRRRQGLPARQFA